MSPNDAIEIPRELIEHLNRGDCVLFAGDALDGGGAQGARLASALVDACGAHCQFCRSEGKCAQPHACAVPLTRAAQLYEGRNGRYSLVDFVRRYLEANYPSRPVPKVYRALADLPVGVMITTAYDDRLEMALELAGRKYQPVVRDTDVPFGDPYRVQLIRLHGTISQPDSLVLTEDDAADLFARLSPVLRVILQGRLAEKTLLFVGYHLGDQHFLSLYRQMTGPIERFQRRSYAVQPSPDPLLVDRWRGKITLLDAEPLPFLTQLRRSIRVQAVTEKLADLPPEPYKFLDYFTRQDAAIFHGRDLEADLLLSTVLAHRLTVFYGRSGTGKTSLLLARVVPALEEAGYRLAYARMLGDPATEVKAVVRGVPADQLAYADRGRRLREVLADALPPAGRLVVVLDQFEEFFVRQGEAVRRAFAAELADCLGRGQTSKVSEDFGSLDIRFVFSLRDDYLGSLDELNAILPQDLFTHRYRLENLTREKALLAILRPAEAFGLPVEEPLRERLIADLADQGLEPANLQIVLYRLYRDAVEQGLWSGVDRQGTGLTLARYEALGGTRDILAGYLDEVLDALPGEAQRQAAKAILKSMVTADRTKAPVSSQEIGRGDLVARVGLDEEQLEAVLGHLRDRRVVRKFGDQDRYELAHEVMVDKVWAWVSDEELRLLDVRDMLRRAMSDYQKFGHLLTSERLGLVTACCEDLALATDELDLLLRSALAAGYEVAYWHKRAPAVVGKVEGELFESLEADDPEQARQAVDQLVSLTSPALVRHLAERVEADFTGELLVWVDPRGGRQAVRRTALNLETMPQRRALQALARMELPEAREALARWTPPGMVLIPAGPFTMGSTESSDEGPVHEVWLAAFWIDRTPVTNAQWAAFLAGDGWQRREFWTEAGRAWREGERPEPDEWKERKGKRDHPVGGISWYEALAYARWAGKGLLSEAQWEKAARGTDGRRYPWGDEFDRDRCNTAESGVGDTTPVGSYSPQGDSPYGLADMAGNVWEWCRNLYVPYRYNATDGREVLEGTGDRVLRGGSFVNFKYYARSASRGYDGPNVRLGDFGVRVGVAAPFSRPSGL